MVPKILVFSQSKSLSQTLCGCLDNQYEVIHCGNPIAKNVSSISMLEVYLFVLDSMRFTKECCMLVQKIKNRTNAPILFLSGNMSPKKRNDEKVQAIEYGVDEYLSQPQSLDEILASIKALLRWNFRINDSRAVWEYQGLKLLPESRQALLHGREIPFTKIEFDIVKYLAFQNGRAVTYKELYEQVWKREYLLDDMNIMAHIHRIRKKLEWNPKEPVYIRNVYGIGYRFG